MKRVRVYYWRNPSWLTTSEGVTHDCLGTSHVHVATVEVDSYDDAFYAMQGEHLPPLEAKRIGELAGHTSMSVGDFLQDEDGDLVVCLPMGWTVCHHPDPVWKGDRHDFSRDALLGAAVDVAEPVSDEEYIRRSDNRCPVCGEDGVEGGNVDIQTPFAFQPCGCVCGARWVDRYVLSGYQELEQP